MKRWELRCYLEDGRVAQADIPLEPIRQAFAEAIGSKMSDLIKHRLYDAYIAVILFTQPAGPELPPELKDNPP